MLSIVATISVPQPIPSSNQADRHRDLTPVTASFPTDFRLHDNRFHGIRHARIIVPEADSCGCVFSPNKSFMWHFL